MAYSNNEMKVFARAARIMEREVRYGDVLSSPTKVRELLQYRLEDLAREVFGMMMLDNRQRARSDGTKTYS